MSCQAVIRATFLVVPLVPAAVATVAADVGEVLNVELWTVVLMLGMKAR